MTSDTDKAVAERAQAVLGQIDSDLSASLFDTSPPSSAEIQEAFEDAEAAVQMLGCALAGAGDLYGGEPAAFVISRWTHIALGKVQLARAIATAAMAGRERVTGEQAD